MRRFILQPCNLVNFADTPLRWYMYMAIISAVYAAQTLCPAAMATIATLTYNCYIRWQKISIPMLRSLLPVFLKHKKGHRKAGGLYTKV